MKVTAKILLLAFIASSVGLFTTSCTSSSSSAKPYNAGGTTTSALIGRQRGGLY
ncbi:MAG: hypothetical protein AAGJ79_04135 [Verrucomicrobiota bacterium]